jgi:hypothetical protein
VADIFFGGLSSLESSCIWVNTGIIYENEMPMTLSASDYSCLPHCVSTHDPLRMTWPSVYEFLITVLLVKFNSRGIILMLTKHLHFWCIHNTVANLAI